MSVLKVSGEMFTVVLTSPEHLGVFDYLQQCNKSPAYTQRHSGGNPLYLYRDDKGYWYVCLELGNSSVGHVLLNKTQCDFELTTNWLYYSYDNWSSDPELPTSISLPSVKPMIKISLDGVAASNLH